MELPHFLPLLILWSKKETLFQPAGLPEFLLYFGNYSSLGRFPCFGLFFFLYFESGKSNYFKY